MVGRRPCTEHARVGIAIVLGLIVLGILAMAGATAAGVKAASHEIDTWRRVELWVLVGLLGLVTLFLGLVLYWIWQLANGGF